MDLENYFKNGKVYVWKETFAIIKAKKPSINAFVNIIDQNEITVIIEQSKCNDEDVIEIEKDLARAEEKLKNIGFIIEEK